MNYWGGGEHKYRKQSPSHRARGVAVGQHSEWRIVDIGGIDSPYGWREGGGGIGHGFLHLSFLFDHPV